jgi:hypothetical protein
VRGSLPAICRLLPGGDSSLFGVADAPRLASVTLARSTGLVAALATSALGCGDALAPASHIETTEILTIRHEVEIGPLNPERVGPLIEGAEKPIAEVLPGDLLRLEAVVVDTAGLQVDVDELETLWLQCGSGPCEDFYITGGANLQSEVFSRRCDQLDDYTTDEYCLLGTGSGTFEFEVPEFGPRVLYSFADTGLGIRPKFRFFGVVSWGGHTAGSCWESRRGDLANLDGCGFIFHTVTIGPIWFAVQRAAELGLELPSSLDPALFPSAVFSQPANRIPETPDLRVLVDDEQAAIGVPPFPPIPVEPGATIEVEFAFDPLTQLFQSSFQPLDHDVSDTFEVSRERLISRTVTSGAIVQSGSLELVKDDGSFLYEVDAFPQPGISRVLIIYRDNRLARDWFSLEFEHR